MSGKTALHGIDSGLAVLIAAGVLLLCASSSTAIAADNLRDPTRPLNFTAQSPSGQRLQLQSIILGEGRRLAFINGQALGEQDVIQGTQVRVVRIQADRVLVQRGSDTWHLTLDNIEVRQPSRNP